jgi:tetratricopeptide (TPR) repeat protein
MRRWSIVAVACLIAPARVPASLTEAPRLAAVYDSILNADFDKAAAQLLESCPPAPEESCKVLSAVSLWWQILIDPESRSLDEQFNAAAAESIAASVAWTRREPQRAESWFYLAGSYGPLVQWRVIRGERLTAAREGKKIKDALEHALKLDPELYDAYFGIGLYHYYADVAPTYARLLRWLLLLPAGDRAKGLQEMLQARERGELARGEADFQLAQIYLWYENRSSDALELFESLDARYPANPIFLERIADAYDVYVHDLDASARAWQRLLDRARDNRVASSRVIEARADRKLRDVIARRAKK